MGYSLGNAIWDTALLGAALGAGILGAVYYYSVNMVQWDGRSAWYD